MSKVEDTYNNGELPFGLCIEMVGIKHIPGTFNALIVPHGHRLNRLKGTIIERKREEDIPADTTARMFGHQQNFGYDVDFRGNKRKDSQGNPCSGGIMDRFRGKEDPKGWGNCVKEKAESLSGQLSCLEPCNPKTSKSMAPLTSVF